MQSASDDLAEVKKRVAMLERELADSERTHQLRSAHKPDTRPPAHSSLTDASWVICLAYVGMLCTLFVYVLLQLGTIASQHPQMQP